MITTTLPSNFASTITPYTAPGREPVGLESPDARPTALKPVEQSADGAPLQNRRDPDDRPNELSQRDQQRSRVKREGGERRADDGSAAADTQQTRELQARDREVRAHERAHASAGGELTGAPEYDYEQGPDGGSYAVSGEVPITLIEVEGDPQATLEMARLARQAALAPEQPSQQDLQVAARAAQLELEARQDLAQAQRQELQLQAAEQALQRQALQEQQALREARRQDDDRLQQRDDNRDSETRAAAADSDEARQAQDRLDQINRRAQELNRRILEIGESNPTPDVGYLLDQVI